VLLFPLYLLDPLASLALEPVGIFSLLALDPLLFSM
jgi:hypothetical protein